MTMFEVQACLGLTQGTRNVPLRVLRLPGLAAWQRLALLALLVPTVILVWQASTRSTVPLQGQWDMTGQRAEATLCLSFSGVGFCYATRSDEVRLRLRNGGG